jgi:hypothetical protein
MYKWVPDGVYDSQSLLTRYEIKDGKPRTVITKMWIDAGGPQDVDPKFKLPWGTYPDMPEKPKKS